MKDELIALIGEKPYGIVAKHCEKRATLDDDLRAVHPATKAAHE